MANNAVSHIPYVYPTIVFRLVCSSPTFSSASLRVGFYRSSCPSAESIVRKTVDKFISHSHNPGLGAGLIRMHFHDCFVRGCDASVLLKSTPGKPSEREHIVNNPSLRGFEVIDEAKAQLEAICPKTVSCSDIIAFAARDSSYKLGGITYAVPAGRRDGHVSNAHEVAQNLPAPYFNAEQLIQTFRKKGLSADEMVTLSGAHSIGLSHCSSFSTQLYTFNSTHRQDSTMDSRFSALLKAKCPRLRNKDGGRDPMVALDPTPNRMDNKYYLELMRNRGVLGSDRALIGSSFTKFMVMKNARNNAEWAAKFAKAMVHLGSIDVLTGTRGEIRTHCNVVN